jgi:hypothetical protein
MNKVRHVVKLQDDRVFCLPAGAARRIQERFRPPRAETGAVAIMFALFVLIIFGIFGLSFDLSRLYNRRIEMQTLADGVALAAARQLNGTTQGVNNALDRAAAAAGKMQYGYNHSPISWAESAIQFSASPEGTWLNADAAKGSPLNLLYARVDTTDLPAAPDMIQTSFIRVLPFAPTTARARARAIAGPSRISVTPFAICAMSPNENDFRVNPAAAGPPAAPANTELVQYGFRRGVGYDLMQLNPTPGATTGLNFLVNPVAPPGTVGMSADMTDAKVGPFLCAGTLAMQRVTGGEITVTSPFPLNTLFDRFNSRFDQYSTGNCDPWSAPPDTNVRSYDRTVAGNVPWMTPSTGPYQAARSTTAGGKLSTVADQLPKNTATAASEYGVLWAFAKAVPFSSFVAGQPEPAGGYTPFTTANWNTLYDPFRPVPAGTQNSGTSSPYVNGTIQPPTHPGVRQRRVLNVPLLACPVGASTARVLGIGKFFMTMPATNSTLYVEFAGLASESSLTTTLELHP